MRIIVLILILSSSALSAAPLPEVRTPEKIVENFSSASRIRVVNLWATWCAPCVAEMKDLKAVDDAFKPAEVEIIGVSFDDMIPGDRTELKKKVERFLAKRSIEYRNVYYVGKMKWMNEYFKFEGELPLTIVFDKKGTEIARHEGPIKRKEFIAQLRALLRK